jgi:hypothetical protein
MAKRSDYQRGIYEGLKLAIRIIKSDVKTKRDIIQDIEYHLRHLEEV